MWAFFYATTTVGIILLYSWYYFWYAIAPELMAATFRSRAIGRFSRSFMWWFLRRRCACILQHFCSINFHLETTFVFIPRKKTRHKTDTVSSIIVSYMPTIYKIFFILLQTLTLDLTLRQWCNFFKNLKKVPRSTWKPSSFNATPPPLPYSFRIHIYIYIYIYLYIFFLHFLHFSYSKFVSIFSLFFRTPFFVFSSTFSSFFGR